MKSRPDTLFLVASCLLTILWTLCLLTVTTALAQDYLQIEPFGVPGVGVYYDEMFRGKVNPAAVGYRRESLAFDAANRASEADTLSLHAEYNTNRLSISDTRAQLRRVRIYPETERVEDAFGRSHDVDELFQAAVSFNIDLNPSLRIGFGQRVSHFNGVNFDPTEEAFAGGYRGFDIDLTAFAIDLGMAARLSRNVYLSLYGQNVLSLIFGEPVVESWEEAPPQDISSEVLLVTIAPPVFDVALPIVVGGGPSLALGQLVASLDVTYLPQLGGSPHLRGTGFYTIFVGGERFRLKLGAGIQTIAGSEWQDDFQVEGVASFWASERLSLKYAAGILQSPDEDSSQFYQRAGISWLWE